MAIVDDHKSMRTALARALRVEGIRSVGFASPAEYLAYPAPSAPFCLILDIELPGMSGPALAQYLASECPPLPPTIFISGHEESLRMLDGNALSHGRLAKPFRMDDLMRLVRPLVGR